MQRKIFTYLAIAGKTAQSKDDERSFLIGAVAIRADGTMVKSLNGPSQHPNRQAHAEYKCCGKIDKGATIYVARIRLIDGEFGLARPCANCLKIMRSKKVKRIYYTRGPNEFGMIDLERQYENKSFKKEISN